MLEIRRLRLLRELAARRTIAAVAKALSFSPSAVSQQLAQLEREVGVPLLERAGRGVRLTDAARTLVEHTEQLLARMDQAEADLARASGQVRGTLRVATFETAGIALLPPALHMLAQVHPDLEIEVVQSDPEESMAALVAGDLDVVISDEYEGDPRPHQLALNRQDLCVDPLRLVLPRDDPLVEHGRPVALSALADRPWAIGPVGHSDGDFVVRMCRELGGFDPIVRHRASNLLILLEVVRSRRAVSILPDLLGADRHAGVAVRPIAERALHRSIFTAVRRGSERRPNVVAVREALSGALESSPKVLQTAKGS